MNDCIILHCSPVCLAVYNLNIFWQTPGLKSEWMNSLTNFYFPTEMFKFINVSDVLVLGGWLHSFCIHDDCLTGLYCCRHCLFWVFWFCFYLYLLTVKWLHIWNHAKVPNKSSKLNLYCCSLLSIFLLLKSVKCTICTNTVAHIHIACTCICNMKGNSQNAHTVVSPRVHLGSALNPSSHKCW